MSEREYVEFFKYLGMLRYLILEYQQETKDFDSFSRELEAIDDLVIINPLFMIKQQKK